MKCNQQRSTTTVLNRLFFLQCKKGDKPLKNRLRMARFAKIVYLWIPCHPITPSAKNTRKPLALQLENQRLEQYS